MSSNTDDVFNENLTPTQCSASALSIGGSCVQFNGVNEVYSTSMTIENCLQICSTTNGFAYAGLNSG